MSIINLFLTEDVPFLPSDDARLPVAMWLSAGESGGDASGGNLTTQIRLREAGDRARVGNYFSLERFNMSTRLATSHRMTPGGFWDFDGPPVVEPPIPLEMSLIIVNLNGLVSSGMYWLPLFLGGVSAPIDNQDLTITGDNAATESHTFFAMGYRWDSSVRQLPGGPRRPEGSVFG